MSLAVLPATYNKSPLRILNKGPNYFRSQALKRDSRPRKSAVQLLEESKHKYVKTVAENRCSSQPENGSGGGCSENRLTNQHKSQERQTKEKRGGSQHRSTSRNRLNSVNNNGAQVSTGKPYPTGGSASNSSGEPEHLADRTSRDHNNRHPSSSDVSKPSSSAADWHQAVRRQSESSREPCYSDGRRRPSQSSSAEVFHREPPIAVARQSPVEWRSRHHWGSSAHKRSRSCDALRAERMAGEEAVEQRGRERERRRQSVHEHLRATATGGLHAALSENEIRQAFETPVVTHRPSRSKEGRLAGSGFTGNQVAPEEPGAVGQALQGLLADTGVYTAQHGRSKSEPSADYLAGSAWAADVGNTKAQQHSSAPHNGYRCDAVQTSSGPASRHIQRRKQHLSSPGRINSRQQNPLRNQYGEWVESRSSVAQPGAVDKWNVASGNGQSGAARKAGESDSVTAEVIYTAEKAPALKDRVHHRTSVSSVGRSSPPQPQQPHLAAEGRACSQPDIQQVGRATTPRLSRTPPPVPPKTYNRSSPATPADRVFRSRNDPVIEYIDKTCSNFYARQSPSPNHYQQHSEPADWSQGPGQAAASTEPRGRVRSAVERIDQGSPTGEEKQQSARPCRRQRRVNLQRSKSDVSGRPTRPPDFDSFFNLMGTDPAVLYRVKGQDHGVFHGMHRSFGGSGGSSSPDSRISTSDLASNHSGGRRRQGGGGGLDRATPPGLPDRLPEQNHSLVAKNARIIKWLVDCRKARAQSIA